MTDNETLKESEAERLTRKLRQWKEAHAEIEAGIAEWEARHPIIKVHLEEATVPKQILSRYSISTTDGREFSVEAEQVDLDSEGHLIFKANRQLISLYNVRFWDRVNVTAEIVQRGKSFAEPEGDEAGHAKVQVDLDEEEGWT